ncbi:MAG: 6-carboxytetrahydropterin synthase QueD [Coriobacteriaceae bacterium]|nr:6-carboxytetrahydropterin synthase QueD [Coriobacteriaceae bacterium]
MYGLSVKSHFDAAHHLPGYPGECAGLHGHTWDVEVVVEGEALDEVGIVYDFKRLKGDLATVLDELDHVCLNDVPPFDSLSPTAENLARHVHDSLVRAISGPVRVTQVSVWESPVARITYRP